MQYRQHREARGGGQGACRDRTAHMPYSCRGVPNTCAVQFWGETSQQNTSVCLARGIILGCQLEAPAISEPFSLTTPQQHMCDTVLATSAWDRPDQAASHARPVCALGSAAGGILPSGCPMIPTDPMKRQHTTNTTCRTNCCQLHGTRCLNGSTHCQLPATSTCSTCD
jgi:hypothetical protein